MKNQLALNAVEEHLEHHGIIGMHWGVRRYQPYPSDYNGDGVYKGKVPKKSFREKKKEIREAREQRAYEDKRDRAIATLDYKTLIKHPDWYTDEELAAALTKSKQIRDITDNMATAKGADFVKRSSALNTAATAAKATVGISTGIISTALLAAKLGSGG